MTPRILSWIARTTGGRLLGEDRVVDAIATDTRALPQGRDALFVALRGASFDGHDHAQAAVDGGCVALLVARECAVAAGAQAVAQVVVPDPQRALADIATAVQRERTRTKVVAITGSNGKTSVKALVEAVLSQAGKTYATPGNRNNEIGLPLAVLDAPDDADFAVYEMGTGAPGDIAYLTAIAPPDVGLVNNVAPAHLERMGSLLAIADTKAAVYDDLRPGGTAVINADDAFAPYFAQRAGDRRVLRFGLEASAEVRARDVRAGADESRFSLELPYGDAVVTLAMPGRHNVRNALAAAAIGHAVGMDVGSIAQGLAAARPVRGRQVAHVLRNGVVLVDDSYNANPGSLAAAIEALTAASRASGDGQAWLVLGDMRELGADEAVLHAQAGTQAKSAGIARLYTLGHLSAHAAQAFGARARQFESHPALVEALAADIAACAGGAAAPPQAAGSAAPKGAALRVLVKGSRGSAMDRIVEALLQRDAVADGRRASDAA